MEPDPDGSEPRTQGMSICIREETASLAYRSIYHSLLRSKRFHTSANSAVQPFHRELLEHASTQMSLTAIAFEVFAEIDAEAKDSTTVTGAMMAFACVSR